MPGKKKGAPKTGGRAKGAENKVTRTAKELVTELVSAGMEKAKQKLDEIEDPKDYLDTLAKFISYVVPKKTETETTVALPVLKTETRILPSEAKIASSEKDVDL
jgi:vacuolar-type H+-ATPase subunit E/Vma4